MGKKIVFSREISTGHVIGFGNVYPIGDASLGNIGLFGGNVDNVGVFSLFNYTIGETGWYESVNIATLGNSVDSGYITTNYLSASNSSGASNA